ncbi:glycoside hydrolase family 2 protein [Lacinutrix iliipiscaria]|uniref:Beta-mannosidase B n=1 Tax=Lacinutrix iliipiscaria TaxID=1230532 RepID=A0ABW5WHN4_9FLAO
MMRCSFLLVFLSFCVACQPKHDVPEIITLNDDWQFKNVKSESWMHAEVPGNVYSDLLKNGIIDDPFIKDNETTIQEFSEMDWEYKTNFKVDDRLLKMKHLELNFEGLDTYASVFLNDHLILKSNNAFRNFLVDVTSQLKSENELRIVFENTEKYESNEKSKLNYSLPEGNRIFTRKAQFQYGWDWGPKLNTSGIWRPIKLKAWNDFKIEDIYLKQVKLTDSVADLIAEINSMSALNQELVYSVYINDSLAQSKEFNPINDNSAIAFQIKNPKRWWPHNLGDPYLYDIKIVVSDAENILDSISVKKGLRTINLVAEKDSLGESFYFKVNGVPVYAKGANYIPQNSLQNQVTNAHYKTLLDDVVAANMNMLRVWGGGIYENDIFYDLCDEKGILIWQDFMFACAMYPGDDAFLKNVKQEAVDNVKRLRNHASIALWCGNNENSEGWHRWGWQANRSEAEKEEIWKNYLKVFDSILPNTVHQFTDIDYWQSSPKYGRGNPKYKFEGDAHDWWIWHDAYPFEHLENNVPRFMSEFGFQSLPSYEVIKYINQNDSIDITSEGFQSHQKHARGFQLIQTYMARDFPVPNNAEDYVYVSQLLQAYGISKGIEAQRRKKPYNMGTLYWQLNDCWPSVSWSSIDFFGNWKALHYQAKHSFEDVLISSEVENDIMKVFVVNDDLKPYSDTLQLQIIDFNGKEILNISESIQVDSNSSRVQYELNLNTLQFNKNEVVIVLKFGDSESHFYLVKPKDLQLKQAEIQKKVTQIESGFQIELSSETLQKNVFLFCNEKGHFSDNYFDLLPNKTKTIQFNTKSKSLNNLQLKTLNSLLTTR